MDDVGQTLLNWASAFGTQEMVEFLCQKGADVNKGQRSSSLHYAACFGRPQIARVLLRFGANPDLRDEVRLFIDDLAFKLFLGYLIKSNPESQFIPVDVDVVLL